MKQQKEQAELEFYKLSVLELTELSNENEAVAYIALKIMFDRARVFESNEDKRLVPKETVIANFNIANLYYELSGRYNLTTTEKTKLNEGVKGLIDSGLVKLIHTDGKENYCLNIAPLFILDGRKKFAMMTQQEIWKIFNISCKQTKQRYSLLRFAVCLFNTFNSNSKCGWCSFRKMPEITATPCVKTCQSYFKMLEENDVIYVHHSKTYKVNETGDIKTLTNVYGRPCDKKAIDAFSNERNKKEAHNFTNNMTTTERGKLTKSYNKYLAHSYTGDTLELIKGCLMYNKQPYQEQNPDEQKDVSVFDPKLVEQAKEELEEYIKKFKKERKEKKAKSSFPKATRSFGRNYNFFDDGDDF